MASQFTKRSEKVELFALISVLVRLTRFQDLPRREYHLCVHPSREGNVTKHKSRLDCNCTCARVFHIYKQIARVSCISTNKSRACLVYLQTNRARVWYIYKQIARVSCVSTNKSRACLVYLQTNHARVLYIYKQVARVSCMSVKH